MAAIDFVALLVTLLASGLGAQRTVSSSHHGEEDEEKEDAARVVSERGCDGLGNEKVGERRGRPSAIYF